LEVVAAGAQFVATRWACVAAGWPARAVDCANSAADRRNVVVD
jgi:hypothetical protein